MSINEEKISLYNRLMREYQRVLDETFWGFDIEVESRILGAIEKGDWSLAQGIMAPFPRFIPFIMKAEHQCLMLRRKQEKK